MCSRYSLKADFETVAKRMSLVKRIRLAKRYNIAPTQFALVIRCTEEARPRSAAMLRWGLVPAWTKDRAAGPLLINARSETAAAKPTFRDAFRYRRCLVVADGFYEWTQHGATKQPYYFTLHHGDVFAMAGLWDRRAPKEDSPGEVVESFTILTTSANPLMASYHDRMPVILEEDFYDDWLNPLLTDAETVQRLMRPYPAEQMTARRVGTHVNNVKFDDPACIEPPATGASHPRHAALPPNGRDTGQMDLGLSG